MSEVRIIVMGSRDFKYYAVISKTLDNFISKLPADKKVVLVSGTCPGADMYGERYAYEHDIEVREVPGEKEVHGPTAVKVRNNRMANYATADGAMGVLFAFWNGKSSGTRDMLKKAKEHGMVVHKYIVGNCETQI